MTSASRVLGLVPSGELLTNLTLKQLRATYKRSVLGFGWSMINPLVTIVVYALVFSVILPLEGEVGDPSGITSYGLFLAAGLLPWQFTATAIGSQASSIVANQALVQKVYLPRWVLPTSALLASAVEFIIELVVLVVLVLVFWQGYTAAWLLVVPVLTLHLAFLIGLGLLLSPLNAAYRDIGHLTGLIIKIWFWLTPIVYSLDVVADRDLSLFGVDALTWFKLNPMLWFTDAYRSLFFDLAVPGRTTFFAMAVSAAVTCIVGVLVFRRFDERIVERL